MSAAPFDRSYLALPLQDEGNDSSRAEASRAACRAYLVTLFEHLPVAVVVLDLAERVTGANPACLRLFGCSAAELAGRALSELITPEPAAAEASGQPRGALHADEPSIHILRRPGGARIHLSVRRQAVRIDGVPVAHYVFCQEVASEAHVDAAGPKPTKRDAEEPEVVLADERQRRLLAGTRSLLDAPEDVDTRLKRLARFLVPAAADSCILYLRDAHDRVRRLEVALASPAQEALLREHLRNYPPVLSRLIPPVARAFATGEPQLLSEVRVRDLKSVPGDDEHVSVAFLLGLSSLLVAPLLRDGRVAGALSLATLDSGRCFQPADLPLVEEIARRAASLIPSPRPGG